LKVSVQPSALADLKAGFAFYETQEAGVGEYFLNSIYSDIDSLRIYAGIHSIYASRFHRLLAKKFPYAIYYQIYRDTARVRAVLDLRRDPKWIARKLKGLV
jgi:hypothetical protein